MDSLKVRTRSGALICYWLSWDELSGVTFSRNRQGPFPSQNSHFRELRTLFTPGSAARELLPLGQLSYVTQPPHFSPVSSCPVAAFYCLSWQQPPCFSRYLSWHLSRVLLDFLCVSTANASLSLWVLAPPSSTATLLTPLPPAAHWPDCKRLVISLVPSMRLVRK